MPDWRYDYRPRSDDTKKRNLQFETGGSLKPRDLKNWSVILVLCAAFIFVFVVGYCEVAK